GSSSAFTVGFINLISCLQGVPRTKLELAREAIHVEQNVLGEFVGVQDQMHAAFGGINRFDFRPGVPFTIRPIDIVGTDLRSLTDWMILVYTGTKRRATDVVAEQVQNTTARRIDSDLSRLLDMVDAGQKILEHERGDRVPIELAHLLHESWVVKKRLSAKISSDEIDALYDRCIEQGALGGKLCGAGGGGFLLMIVPPERRSNCCEALLVRRAVLAIGHMAERIVAHYGQCQPALPISLVRETEPLGTGGALINALPATASDPVLGLNGDSLFRFDVRTLLRHHLDSGAEATLALV